MFAKLGKEPVFSISCARPPHRSDALILLLGLNILAAAFGAGGAAAQQAAGQPVPALRGALNDAGAQGVANGAENGAVNGVANTAKAARAPGPVAPLPRLPRAERLPEPAPLPDIATAGNARADDAAYPPPPPPAQ